MVIATWPLTLEALANRLHCAPKNCELELAICKELTPAGLVLSDDERLVVNHLSRRCRDHLIAVRNAWANLRAVGLVRPVGRTTLGTRWAVVLHEDGDPSPRVAA